MVDLSTSFRQGIELKAFEVEVGWPSGQVVVQGRTPGRSRMVWSAGHCSPLFHATLALIYGTLRRKGFTLTAADAGREVFPEQLIRFRRWGGPSGHVESQYALAGTSTGSFQDRVFGIEGFARSGNPAEIYRAAGFDAAGLRKKLSG